MPFSTKEVVFFAARRAAKKIWGPFSAIFGPFLGSFSTKGLVGGVVWPFSTKDLVILRPEGPEKKIWPFSTKAGWGVFLPFSTKEFGLNLNSTKGGGVRP